MKVKLIPPTNTFSLFLWERAGERA